MTEPATSRTGGPLDIDALRSLSSAYAAAVDARAGEQLAALFVESGELLVPDVPADVRPVISRTGPDEIRLVPEGLRRYARTFHQVSDHRFVVDGDRATGDVQCVAHHVSTASSSVPGHATGTDTVWYIRYRDDYVRTDAGWRFARRALHLQWIAEHPVTLLPVEGDSSPEGASRGRESSPAGKNDGADRGQASGTSCVGGGPA